jgi:hypothetical protein
MKIYLASSWRNQQQPYLVEILRNCGHEVYDFRHRDNAGKEGGFLWSHIDPNWQSWTATEYRQALTDPIAIAGFNRDFQGMK